ncbi:MAG: DoxX family protein [Gemmatimonadales bacterium]
MTPNSKVDWILRGLVAVALLVMGIIPKLTNDPTMLANFARWGYPSGFHYVVAAGEIAGVLLLLIPSTALWGALLVDALMVGAAATHLKAGEYGFAPIPLVIGALAVATALPRLKARRQA